MITLTPDSQRLTNQPATYYGEAPKGQVVSLPRGALVSMSGMPLLMPVPRPISAEGSPQIII